MAEQDEDFLRRWSRRKAQARSGPRRSPPTDEEAPPAGAARSPAAGPGVERAAHVQGGPPAAPASEEPQELEFDEAEIDRLDYDSDFTRFLKAGVPAAIRRKALRKLWASNPMFGRHDGLDDYYVTADFTDQARAVGQVASSWRPGIGYKSDEELDQELAADAEAHKAQEVAEAPASEATPRSPPEAQEHAGDAASGDAAAADERPVPPGQTATAGDDPGTPDRDDQGRA